MHQETKLAQRMADLLSQLHLMVRRPTCLLRLDEIRDIVAELGMCWDRYRHQGEDTNDNIAEDNHVR